MIVVALVILTFIAIEKIPARPRLGGHSGRRTGSRRHGGQRYLHETAGFRAWGPDWPAAWAPLFASWQGGVFPNNFDFPQLVTVYCMLILGGAGNIWGVVLAAIILAVLPEALREYGQYRMILYGLLLVIMMILRPQGLLGERPSLRRRSSLVQETSNGRVCSAEELFYEETAECVKPLEKKAFDPEKIMLKLDGLGMDFGGVTAVSDLDLEIREGEIVSLIGPNGAGKTTVFNIITGIYAPTRGRVIFQGPGTSPDSNPTASSGPVWPVLFKPSGFSAR